jgi:nitrogen fixation NifU-like protein
MDDSLRDLYQDVILDHNKRPRNFRSIPEADAQLDGYNPLCGDRLTLFVKMEGDTVADVSFQGQGCAISTASASLMTEAVKGKSKAEAMQVFTQFIDLVTRKGSPDAKVLGKLKVFSGVGEFPARVKCATLCWHTLQSALQGRTGKVSTES